ncbi:MAG TPA: hypothetical protein VH234_05580 [Candidatus Saccharimonadales bacterium]|jgi:hypothetical protein|nr:hypothetical protein [Candidatus Saccharimonadales bacterium]
MASRSSSFYIAAGSAYAFEPELELDPEETFQKIKQRRARSPGPPKARLKIVPSSRQVYEVASVKRMLHRHEGRILSLFAREIVAASTGNQRAILGSKQGVSILTDARALAIFGKYYQPAIGTDGGSKRFNEIVQNNTLKINNERPQLDATLGKICIMGSAMEGAPKFVAASIVGPGAIVINEEQVTLFNELAGAVEAGIPHYPNRPHTSLITVRSQNTAEVYAELLQNKLDQLEQSRGLDIRIGRAVTNMSPIP